MVVVWIPFVDLLLIMGNEAVVISRLVVVEWVVNEKVVVMIVFETIVEDWVLIEEGKRVLISMTVIVD